MFPLVASLLYAVTESVPCTIQRIIHSDCMWHTEIITTELLYNSDSDSDRVIICIYKVYICVSVYLYINDEDGLLGDWSRLYSCLTELLYTQCQQPWTKYSVFTLPSVFLPPCVRGVGVTASLRKVFIRYAKPSLFWTFLRGAFSIIFGLSMVFLLH